MDVNLELANPAPEMTLFDARRLLINHYQTESMKRDRVAQEDFGDQLANNLARTMAVSRRLNDKDMALYLGGRNTDHVAAFYWLAVGRDTNIYMIDTYSGSEIFEPVQLQKWARLAVAQQMMMQEIVKKHGKQLVVIPMLKTAWTTVSGWLGARPGSLFTHSTDR